MSTKRHNQVYLAKINSHRHNWDGSVCSNALDWSCGANSTFRERYCSRGRDSCFHTSVFAPQNPVFEADFNTLDFLDDSPADAFENRILLFVGQKAEEPWGIQSGPTRILGGYHIRSAFIEDQISRKILRVVPHSDAWFRLPWEASFSLPADSLGGDVHYFRSARMQDFESAIEGHTQRLSFYPDGLLSPADLQRLQSFVRQLPAMKQSLHQPASKEKTVQCVRLRPGHGMENAMREDPILKQLAKRVGRREEGEANFEDASREAVEICSMLEEISPHHMQGQGLSIATFLSAMRYRLSGFSAEAMGFSTYPPLVAALLHKSDYVLCHKETDHRVVNQFFIPSGFKKIDGTPVKPHSEDDYRHLLFLQYPFTRTLPSAGEFERILKLLFELQGEARNAIGFRELASAMKDRHDVDFGNLKAVLSALGYIGAESQFHPSKSLEDQHVHMMVPDDTGLVESVFRYFRELVERERGYVLPEALMRTLGWQKFEPRLDLSPTPEPNPVPAPKPIQTKAPPPQNCLPEAECLEALRENYSESVIEALQLGSLAQNLILLKGCPGVGKSTLATSLLTDESRHLVVPVSASWQCFEDFLGYVNPVHQEFEATAATEFLIRISEMEEKGDSRFTVLVLEEFNLSQPEFWLGEILVRMSASSREDRRIHLGGKGVEIDGQRVHSFVLPKNLRILGTMNEDHTVRDLSPRVLDRSFSIEVERKTASALHQMNLEVPSEVSLWLNALDELLSPLGFTLSMRAATNVQVASQASSSKLSRIIQKVLVHQSLPTISLSTRLDSFPGLAHEIETWLEGYGSQCPIVAEYLKRSLNQRTHW